MTTTNAIQETTQTKPQVKLGPVQRMEVQEGMTLADILANGSEPQKIVAKAFDDVEERYDYKKGDEIFDKAEAAAFNDYRFALDREKKELRAHNISTNGHVTIKYNSLDELKQNAALVREADEMSGDVVFDLRTKTATYSDVSADEIYIGGGDKFKSVTIRNANVSRIDALYYKGSLKLENVAETGILWDSKTEVSANSEAKVAIDSGSKINLGRYTEE